MGFHDSVVSVRVLADRFCLEGFPTMPRERADQPGWVTIDLAPSGRSDAC